MSGAVAGACLGPPPLATLRLARPSLAWRPSGRRGGSAGRGGASVHQRRPPTRGWAGGSPAAHALVSPALPRPSPPPSLDLHSRSKGPLPSSHPRVSGPSAVSEPLCCSMVSGLSRSPPLRLRFCASLRLSLYASLLWWLWSLWVPSSATSRPFLHSLCLYLLDSL